MYKPKPHLRTRLAALGLDYLIIVGWMAILAVASLLLYLIIGTIPDYLGALGPIGTQALFFMLLTFPVGLYLFITESGPRHATFGKRNMGITVTSVTGRSLTRTQILARTCVKLLPWEIAHTFVWQLQYAFYQHGAAVAPEPWILFGLNVAMILAVIYAAMVIFRRDGRGPHDFAAGTQVVTQK